MVLIVLVYGCATSEKVFDQQRSELSNTDTMGELRVEIHSPVEDQRLTSGETSVLVEGGASNFGGVRYFDLMFVLDSSKSLLRSDPKDYLSAGATGLVESLSQQSDIHIGVVGFNTKGRLLLPLTQDRGDVTQVLSGLPRSGGTDVATGIRTALKEFETNARPDSSRVIMLFTDGQSNARKARQAMEEAAARSVAVHTLLLGSSAKGASILQEIARGTGASFIQVLDPAKLPEAFLNLRTTGVESVALHVNDGEPIPTHLAGGTFSASVSLQPGENRIVAVATSLSGNRAESGITVNAGPPNCAILEVMAVSDGQPTMSINERAVEIVVDASRSMWGRMDGQPKMVVAKEILRDVSGWFPDELNLALRAYGNTSASELKDCADSELLVAFGDDNREPIRQAIADLRPLGQTPLAYALNQVTDDFGDLQGERAVVLVTDGIESCGGDPVAAARTLSNQDIAIHVIGFGLGNTPDEDAASLDAIAQASGGRFLMALSAAELKEALIGTVGTPFQVVNESTVVANSALGSGEPILLPEGEFRIQVNSSPPYAMQVNLVPGEKVSMTLEKEEGVVSHSEQRHLVGYTPCTEPEY
jgi:Mg-chelatase subunit ChlD